MSSLSLTRQGHEDSEVRRSLLPPPLLRKAHDPRRSADASHIYPAASAVKADVVTEWPIRPCALTQHDVHKADTEFVKGAGGEGYSQHVLHAPPKDRPLRAELKPPRRELDVVKTTEALRRMRHDDGLLRELTLQEIQDFAEVCSPLGFQRSDFLFCRGEVATWFGILLSGQVAAYVPSESGSEVILGSHGPGEVVGGARASNWKNSHVRAYTLKGSEAGYVATLTYDQLEGLRRARPSLHYILTRLVLSQLADAAAGFFYGCPLSDGVRWPVATFHERRVLDFFLRLREDEKLFVGVDYRALLALACRVRITHWKARAAIMSRGSPLFSALIVLDGKLTGFRDSSSTSSSVFLPGDIVGVEGALGSVWPCSLDVFAARDTLAALLYPEDLADLAREFPTFATQVVTSLYQRLFSVMADPHGSSLLLLAEGAKRVRFAPGTSPSQPPGQQPGVPGLRPDDAPTALRLADTTLLRYDGLPLHNDDAALHHLLGRDVTPQPNRDTLPNRWQIGTFFAEKLAAAQTSRRDHTKLARRATFHVDTNSRPTSAPPVTSRHHPDLQLADRRKPGASFLSELTKGAAGCNTSASEFHPNAPVAPTSVGLRHVLAMAHRADRPDELLRRSLIGQTGAPHAPFAVKRASSAPPSSGTDPRAPGDHIEKSWRGPISPVMQNHSRAVSCHHCGALVSNTEGSWSRPPQHREKSPSDGLSAWHPQPWSTSTRPQKPGEIPSLHSMPSAKRYETSPRASGSSLHAFPHPDGLRQSDLQAHFEQQRQFMVDLRGAAANPEESVAADQHQAWNLKVLSQQHEIERLRKQVQMMEEANRKLLVDQTKVLRERDEWKASSLRSRLNKEFAGMVENLNADERRFLRAKCNNPMPDFEKSLRQQLDLMETPLENLSAEGVYRHNAADSLGPPALRTFPRMGGAVVT